MKQQSGMTLLEVLISILIIGIGLTSSIAMIQSAVRYTESAADRSVAMFYLGNMINKMKVNPTAVSTYLNNKPSELTVNCDIGALYAPDEQAKCDLREWYLNARLDLVDPIMKVESLRPNANLYRASIQWTKSNESNQSFGDVSDTISIIFSI